MTLVGTSWYLCVLFLLACVGISAMTVTPEGAARAKDIMTLVLAVMSVVSGLGAALLTWQYRRNREAAIFSSKPLARGCVGFAVVATFIVLLGVVG